VTSLVVQGFVVIFHNGMKWQASITTPEVLVVVDVGIRRVNFAIFYSGLFLEQDLHPSSPNGIIIKFLELHNTFTKDRLRWYLGGGHLN
jgi:hypothetical protein